MTPQITRVGQAFAALAVSYFAVRAVLYALGCAVMWMVGAGGVAGLEPMTVGAIALGIIIASLTPTYIAWRVYAR